MSTYSSETGRWAEYVDEEFAQLTADLTLYGEEVTKKVKKACRKVASETKDDIVRDSPKKSGDYKEGWRAVKVFEDANEVRYIVKNKDKPQLTYLLEYGHIIVLKKGTAKVTKGRVDGKPHIRPAELKAKGKLTALIKEAVKE